MRQLIFLMVLISIVFDANSQSPVGAWEGLHASDDGKNIKTVVIFSDAYQVMTQHDADSGAFIMTNGGAWKLEGDTMTETVEFDTKTPERVGSQVSFKVHISDTEMHIVDGDNKLTRIDDGTPGKLQGAWLMSGRVRDGKTQTRDINRPRKTMKILSGTRFQWTAYNTETKQFMGAGGGTYTTINGKYTENIEYFSRDDNKVGMSLGFDFRLDDGKWHHQGFSSKGDPMHEIWSPRN